MWIELFLLIGIGILYFLCYVETKINKNDEVYYLDKPLTRNNIVQETYLKLPFYFDGTHLNEKISRDFWKKRDKRKNYYAYYEKPYVSISLLEPFIRFTPQSFVYEIIKHGPLISHTTSFNYYLVKKGQCLMTFIHPKYKENFFKNGILNQNKSKIDYIKKQNYFSTISFSENSMIYVPNKWIVYFENIETKDPCIIECTEYQTICNQLLCWGEKQFNKMI